MHQRIIISIFEVNKRTKTKTSDERFSKLQTSDNDITFIGEIKITNDKLDTDAVTPVQMMLSHCYLDQDVDKIHSTDL